ncbi:unnamed protein product [Polarella glacialis]|uniref:Reverse transcriptase domain-containing protein n=1 Tax=Polarella glacialis TaxID=89957 RepID=A0A813GR75_POLGL|nr:unnamed protein product [Polarella glacialis]
MDDLCSDSASQILAYGGSSSQWVNPSLGQGRILYPLLFNIVVNGAAVSAKRACPGVALGPELGAPRVSVLLYADDIVLLAETAQELQDGLDVIAAWARRWRFTFSPGPEKSAVMVVSGPMQPELDYRLGSTVVPYVEHYPYLGVIFDHKGKWGPHVDHVTSRCDKRFAECAAWALREKLDLQWCDNLFRSYSLPAFLHGSELAAVVSRAVALMNKSLRTRGRRLLRFPRGSPIAAVFGDLGWSDADALALDRAAGLFGRLRCRALAASRSEIPGMVFRYALRHRSSWACWAAASFGAAGAPSAQLSGVGPGAPLVVSRRWRRDAVLLALVSASHRRFLESTRSVASLSAYLGAQPLPRLQTAVHNRRVPATDARFRGLARCGHHVFADGRISRHLVASSRCLLCGAPDGSLNHLLASCPACRDLRVLWCRRTGTSLCDAVQLVAEP